MSERTEKQISRSERPIVTPQPTRPSLFDWIEDKFTGREAMPRYFELHQAVGQGGRDWRPEVIHQKEFKVNIKKPERDEMVELANKFYSLAQEHCNEAGVPQGYVLLAINHTKSSHPYGIHYMKLRPIHMSSLEAASAGDGEVTSDNVHRDRLLHHSLEHQKSNDEHARFMQDAYQRSVGSVLTLQQEIIRELRMENSELKGQQLNWWKAIQEAEDRTEERKIKSARDKVKIELMERGAGLLMQMVPVVAKTLERNKNGGSLPASADTTLGPSPESIAIEQFVRTLTEPQKIALFGAFDEAGTHHPGIFSGPQVKIFADVAELRLPPTALAALLPGGEHAIEAMQIAKAQEHVSMDQLMPLYAIIKEGQNQAEANAPAQGETHGS